MFWILVLERKHWFYIAVDFLITFILNSLIDKRINLFFNMHMKYENKIFKYKIAINVFCNYKCACKNHNINKQQHKKSTQD